MPLMKYLYIMKMDKEWGGEWEEDDGEVRRVLCEGIKRVDLFACESLDDELKLPARWSFTLAVGIYLSFRIFCKSY